MEPPNNTKIRYFVWLIIEIEIIILIFFGFWWAIQSSRIQPSDQPIPMQELPDLALIQNNSLVAISNPETFSAQVLGILIATKEPIIRVVTAFNPVISQTDSTPCITASGLNVCRTRVKICASNEFLFGQRLLIEGEVWEVQDRTNKRYSYLIDLLMYDEKEAFAFGKKILEIYVLD